MPKTVNKHPDIVSAFIQKSSVNNLIKEYGLDAATSLNIKKEYNLLLLINYVYFVRQSWRGWAIGCHFHMMFSSRRFFFLSRLLRLGRIVIFQVDFHCSCKYVKNIFCSHTDYLKYNVCNMYASSSNERVKKHNIYPKCV